MGYILYYLNKLVYKNETYPSNLKILIAGCGSDQAAIIAKCNPNHSVIGIDISPKSIAHQNKLKKNHKINNLKLICDDFRDIKLYCDSSHRKLNVILLKIKKGGMM